VGKRRENDGIRVRFVELGSWKRERE